MKSIRKIVRLLKYLASEQHPRGVTEISNSLGCNKTSTYRLLSTLKSVQWVSKDLNTKKYTIGTGLQELSAFVLSNLTLRSASLPYLNELSEATGELVALSARVGLERVYMEKANSDHHEIGQIVEIGKRYPLWKGAAGKVILAYMEPGEIVTVIKDLSKSGTAFLASGQALKVGVLKGELAEIAKVGFCISIGERALGIAAVAAPIFGRNNQVLGALSVGGPVPRFNRDLATKFAPTVIKAAKEISAQLGYVADSSAWQH